jgi:hypothetical protein
MDQRHHIESLIMVAAAAQGINTLLLAVDGAIDVDDGADSSSNSAVTETQQRSNSNNNAAAATNTT